MIQDNKFKIRCRGIILHEDKLLVVRHQEDAKYTALPGGHLEPGEGIEECMRREFFEELGIQPTIGRLLYVNDFMDGEYQSIEFFFEVVNGVDFVGCHLKERSHAFELCEIHWVSSGEESDILPSRIADDLRGNTLLSDQTRFIRN